MNGQLNPGKINPDFLAWLLLFLLTLIWGSSFILIKKGLEAFSPLEVGAFRIWSAGIVLFPFTLKKVKSDLQNKEWIFIIISGLLGSLVPSILFAIAETSLDSGATGILNALTPLMTLMVGVILFKNKLFKSQSLGLALGFLGTIVFMLSGSGNGLKSFNANGFLVILATMCYGLNLNYIKTYLSKVNAITISSYSLVIILPLTSLILFYDGAFIKAINSNPATLTPLYYLLILGIVGTALALVLFNRLVQLKEPVFASSVTYLIPIVAIIWGIIDGENLLSTHYFGLIIIISGVYLANKKRAK